MSENILAVNIPNIISITLMAVIGFFLLNLAMAVIASKAKSETAS